MSIDGFLQQPVRSRAIEREAVEQTRAAAPLQAGRRQPTEDIIDIKAMKTILYLGIRGDMFLPGEEAHLVDTRA